MYQLSPFPEAAAVGRCWRKPVLALPTQTYTSVVHQILSVHWGLVLGLSGTSSTVHVPTVAVTVQVSGWQGARELHSDHGSVVVYRGMTDCFVRTGEDRVVCVILRSTPGEPEGGAGEECCERILTPLGTSHGRCTQNIVLCMALHKRSRACPTCSSCVAARAKTTLPPISEMPNKECVTPSCC